MCVCLCVCLCVAAAVPSTKTRICVCCCTSFELHSCPIKRCTSFLPLSLPHTHTHTHTHTHSFVLPLCSVCLSHTTTHKDRTSQMLHTNRQGLLCTAIKVLFACAHTRTRTRAHTHTHTHTFVLSLIVSLVLQSSFMLFCYLQKIVNKCI